VFNHESYVDPLILGALLAPSIVAKASTAQLPFIGLYGHALQARRTQC
jgi:1-acyl-sn-glycerol-3-phosphate acyltransferase